MQPGYSKRYYTPQFSALGSVSVRRFAWAVGKPMTKAMDSIIQLLPFIMEPEKVCAACKDKTKCQNCAFHVRQLSEEEQIAKLAAL